MEFGSRIGAKGRVEKPNGYYQKLRRYPAPIRVVIGVLLIAGGVLGFLPILGFWMIPLGLAVIFIDAPLVKRMSSRIRKAGRRLMGRKPEEP